jgi:AraC family transcriptional regulator of adaptative response/methylated-DNA-[protein]-cysteine methyltransferase
VSLIYTVTDSPLGRLLVAATDRGVSAVYLGDADGPLETALREEYPAAERRRDDAALTPTVQAILAHLEGRFPRLDLPVDVKATAFQWKVWQALRAIPPGETRSYGEIARAVGRPTGARAVARACATNPVSIVIPCHRVVGGDGRLTGYRWGVERKRALLAREEARKARRA